MEGDVGYRLGQALGARALLQEPAAGGARFDGLLEGPFGRIRFEVKRLATIRMDDLIGRLAQGVLELANGNESIPLVAVSVPRVTNRARDTAERFMVQYAPSSGWALLGDDGALVVSIPGHPRISQEPTEPPRDAQETARPDASLFTDLNRWLLKVLLYGELGNQTARYGPQLQRPRDAAELCRIAETSPATTHRFVASLKARGFLREGRRLGLMQHALLFNELLAHERLNRRQPVAVVTQGRSLHDLMHQPRGFRAALCGLSAAEAHGVARVDAAIPGVQVDCTLAALREAWGAEPSPHGGADLLVFEARYPESVFRATIQLGGVEVVDLLQIALDETGRPPRGTEQAEFVVEKIMEMLW